MLCSIVRVLDERIRSEGEGGSLVAERRGAATRMDRLRAEQRAVSRPTIGLDRTVQCSAAVRQTEMLTGGARVDWRDANALCFTRNESRGKCEVREEEKERGEKRGRGEERGGKRWARAANWRSDATRRGWRRDEKFPPIKRSLKQRGRSQNIREEENSL